MEPETISLATICHGSVPEIFERELNEVLKNIADPNTAPEKARSITLRFTVKPTEDRSGADIDFSCRSSLQPVKLVKSRMFLSRHTGLLKAYAQDQRQVQMFNSPASSGNPMSVVK